MKQFLILAVALAVIFGISAACVQIPIQQALAYNIQNIYILPVEDHSSTPAVVQMLNEKIPEAFINNGRLKVTPKEQADIILRTTLQRYDEIVIQRDAYQQPERFRMQVMLDADMIDAKTGKVLLTTRRTVDLTPQTTDTSVSSTTQASAASVSPTSQVADAGATDTSQAFDSTEVRTLVEFNNYYTINTLGKKSEDETTAQEQVTDQMVTRIIDLIIDGSFDAETSATTSLTPVTHGRHQQNVRAQ